MYILFYPLKFPSTPVLILFKVLQHYNNLLWPRTGLEPAFIHRYRDYLQTCAYFLIQHLAARDTVSPPVRLCILHTPPAVGATFPFAYQVIWSGRQDSNLRPLVRSVYKIRTYDTSFIIQTHQFLSLLVNCNQNQCSSQLNYFPKCVVFYNTSFLFVAHSRIELLFQEWKSCGLTVSRVRHK